MYNAAIKEIKKTLHSTIEKANDAIRDYKASTATKMMAAAKAVAIVMALTLPCMSAFADTDVDVYRGNFVYTIGSYTRLKQVINPEMLVGQLDVPLYFTYEGRDYNVDIVNTSCFAGCRNITSIVLYSKAQENDSYHIQFYDKLFVGCESLKTVDFPNIPMMFEPDIFKDNEKIEHVIIRSDQVPEVSLMSGTPVLDAFTTLYVPEDALSDYESAAWISRSLWGLFDSISSIEDFAEAEPVRGENPLSDDTDAVFYSFSIKQLSNNVYLAGMEPQDYRGKVTTPPVKYDSASNSYLVINRIDENCFEGCDYVTEIEIVSDESYTSFGIYEDMGRAESVRRISLPKALKNIDKKAFQSMGRLRTVVCDTPGLPSLYDEDLSTDLSKVTLFVPESLIEQFKEDKEGNYWKDFGRILPIGAESGENVIFRFSGYEVEFYDVKAGHLIETAGCRVLESGEGEYSVESGIVEINVPGGVIIQADPEEASTLSASDSPHISLGSAKLRLSDLAAGDMFDVTLPSGHAVSVSTGCDVERLDGNKYSVTVTDPEAMSMVARAGGQSGISLTDKAGISIHKEGGTITILGLSRGERIRVYDMRGILIHESRADGQSDQPISIELPGAGHYIIATSRGAAKISL